MAVSRSEIRMIGRAIRERWPISDERRASLVETLLQVAEDPSADNRARVNAAKVVVEMDKLNIVEEKGPPVHNHLHLTQSEGMSLEERRRVLIDRAARIGHEPRGNGSA